MKYLPLLLLLTACASVPHTVPVLVSAPAVETTKTEVQKVEVPVIYRCKADIGPAPAYPDTNTALLALPFPNTIDQKQKSYNLFYSVRLMAAGRLIRDARIHQLEVALDGCRTE